MLNLTPYFDRLQAFENLSPDAIRDIMTACFKGEISDAQLGIFLALMRVKGETLAELMAAADVMMAAARPITLGYPLLDIVGTGGDGMRTFNISSVTAVVAAAAGAKIAKHGGQAVSSASGHSDWLTAAGMNWAVDDETLQIAMDRYGICFLLASHFHPAMRFARPARQALGLRSFFNLLGPLVNPARVSHQILGVCEAKWQEPLGDVLVHLGRERIMVVHAEDGMDEVSIAAPTHIYEYQQGAWQRWSLDPKTYDCYHPSIDALQVNTPEESVALTYTVLRGEKGPARDIIVLNTALALYCLDIESDFSHAIVKAADTIDSGAASCHFEALQQFTPLA